MQVSLTRGQRFPVISFLEGRFPGPKTLIVQAVKNWPVTVGQMEPSVPLDIEIHIRAKCGNVYVEEFVSLPNLGLRRTFDCDEISADAYYTPNQGLAVPYQTYNISASVVNLSAGQSVSSFAGKFDYAHSIVSFPAQYQQIPAFATEVRVVTDVAGRIALREHSGANVFNMGIPTTALWRRDYDLLSYNHWQSLSPLAWEWQVNAHYYPSSSFYANYSIAVEFR